MKLPFESDSDYQRRMESKLKVGIGLFAILLLLSFVVICGLKA